MQEDDSTTEDRLKQTNAAPMWTSLRQGDHCDLECEVDIIVESMGGDLRGPSKISGEEAPRLRPRNI